MGKGGKITVTFGGCYLLVNICSEFIPLEIMILSIHTNYFCEKVLLICSYCEANNF